MIFEKLFKLQNEIGAIVKSEKNPFFKSSYFSINGLLEQLQPLLSKHGLCVLQPLTNIDGKSAIATIVVEVETGDKFEMPPLPLPDLTDPQKVGSAITYMRRFSLQSLLLLQAEDDDGNAAAAKVIAKCGKCKKEFSPSPSWVKECPVCKT